MQRIGPLFVLQGLLLVGCTSAGAIEPNADAVADGDAVEWSVDELVTLPPVDTATGVPATAAGTTAPTDIAAIRRDGAVLRVRDGHVDVDAHPGARPGVVGLDGRTLVDAVTLGDGSTEVHWADVFTGEKLGHAFLDGSHLVPTVTDTTGRYVALVNEDAPLDRAQFDVASIDGTIAAGRTSSTIVIADRELGERYRTTLDGNFHPEAFGDPVGPAGVPDIVYLLEYLPADAPTHYRVRVLHTASGEIGLPVNLRDKSRVVDAEMAGYSRTQVVSGHDGGLLFTLYRGVAGEGDRHGYAFVHTLGFAGGVWCLDIAPEMELDRLSGALVVAGDRLVVASANGTVGSYDISAVLDPTREPVMDVVTQFLHPDGEPVMTATDERVWVAWANFVYELDPVTLEMLAPAPQQRTGTVTALAATDAQLVIGYADGAIESTGATSIDVTPDDIESGDGIVALLVDELVAGASEPP